MFRLRLLFVHLSILENRRGANKHKNRGARSDWQRKGVTWAIEPQGLSRASREHLLSFWGEWEKKRLKDRFPSID